MDCVWKQAAVKWKMWREGRSHLENTWVLIGLIRKLMCWARKGSFNLLEEITLISKPQECLQTHMNVLRPNTQRHQTASRRLYRPSQRRRRPAHDIAVSNNNKLRVHKHFSHFIPRKLWTKCFFQGPVSMQIQSTGSHWWVCAATPSLVLGIKAHFLLLFTCYL